MAHPQVYKYRSIADCVQQQQQKCRRIIQYLDDEVLLCDEEARVQLLDAVVDDGQRLVQRQALHVLPVHHRQRERRAVPVRTVWYLTKQIKTKRNEPRLSMNESVCPSAATAKFPLCKVFSKVV